MAHPFPNPLETVCVGGFETVRADRDELANWIAARCLASRDAPDTPPAVILSSNGQGIALQGQNSGYDAAMASADVIHADGMPVVMASHLMTDAPIRGRSATTDLFHDVAHLSVEHGLKLYVLGAQEEQNRRAVEKIRERYPGLQIVGNRHGYFSDDEDPGICAEIVASGADVLWVALGKPKQEIWSTRNRARLSTVGCVITCGGLYAFLAGDVKRAPNWMQRIGVEWLYRLLGDPRRLARRYVVTNAQALYRLLCDTRRQSSR